MALAALRFFFPDKLSTIAYNLSTKSAGSRGWRQSAAHAKRPDAEDNTLCLYDFILTLKLDR